MWFQTTAITLLFSLLSVLYLVPTRDRKKRDSDARDLVGNGVFWVNGLWKKELLRYDIGNYCEGQLWRKSMRNCFVICHYFRHFETVVGCLALWLAVTVMLWSWTSGDAFIEFGDCPLESILTGFGILLTDYLYGVYVVAFANTVSK